MSTSLFIPTLDPDVPGTLVEFLEHTNPLPGEDIALQNIRLKYYYDKNGNIRNTLAYRIIGDQMYFGIATYNPSDRKLKIQPSKKRGRDEAIKRLYESEVNHYWDESLFLIDSSGRVGCCDRSKFWLLEEYIEAL